jgi:hypothetical protein
VALTTNLVFCLEMDEAAANATADDAHSAGPYHFTANGAAAAGSTAGKIGTARTLNGSDQDFSRAHDAAYSCSGDDWTISMWFYYAGVGGYYAAKQDASHGEFQLRVNGGEFVVLTVFGSSGFGGQSDFVSTLTPTSSAWNHVLVTYEDGVGSSLTLNNGTPQTQAHAPGIYNSSGAFVIGSQRPYGSWATGNIDQFAFWRGRAGLGGDFATLYNSGSGLAYSSWGGGGGGTKALPLRRKPTRFFRVRG